MSTSSPNRHVILALNTKGLGEGLLGLNLARELQKEGDEVFFLAHESNQRLFQAGFPHMTFSDEAAALLQFYIKSCLLSVRATSLILSDYLTAMLFFEGVGQDPRMLGSLGIPISAVDTWDSTRTPDHIDLFVDGFDQYVPQVPGYVKSICPVPFLAPHTDAGFYGSLPVRTTPRGKASNSFRKGLGLPAHASVVLFCSAEWQHPGAPPVKVRKNSPRGREYQKQWAMSRRLSEMLPVLLAEYLMRVGPEVHLVHVGPRAFDLRGRLEGRYHWQAPLSPGEFDRLLSGADLLVSANISATTITKAMVYEVPVLVLQNSVSGQTRSEAEAGMAAPPSPWMSAWLDEAVPFYPFALWPLGYHRFLAPLLSQNPYVKALEIVEMLDEAGVESALHGLLFDPVRRAEQAHRQAAYLMQVRSLPTGAQLIKANLAAA